MTLRTVEKVATRFLQDSAAGVLAIKGEWGVGKTYFWDQLISTEGARCSRATYSYVSLFGVTSISDLRAAIFAKQRPLKAEVQPPTDVGAVKRLAQGWAGRLLGWTRALKDAEYGQFVTVGVESLAHWLVKDLLICIDDFERMDEGVSADHLLGYISELRHERNCKVVLIFNDSKLTAAKRLSYAKYREKVVDAEVTFDLNPVEAASIALRGETSEHIPRLRDLADRLQVRNIRVLRKISESAKMMLAEAGDVDSSVKDQILASTVLFAWSYFDTADDRPTFEFLRKWNSIAYELRKEAKGKHEDDTRLDDEASKRQRWAAILDKYHYLDTDELDLAIAAVIERGYTEETGFNEAVRAADAHADARGLRDAYSERWGLYRDSFENNATELMAGLDEAFRESVTQLEPGNLDETVTLFRELGNDKLAGELIEFYIQAYPKWPKQFDLKYYAFGDRIKDQRLIQRFAEVHAASASPASLEEAVGRIIASSGGIRREDINALKAANDEDVYALFKNHAGEKYDVVNAFVQFRHQADNADIAEKANRVLMRIGKECQLNAIRVRRYGVHVDSDAKT